MFDGSITKFPAHESRDGVEIGNLPLNGNNALTSEETGFKQIFVQWLDQYLQHSADAIEVGRDTRRKIVIKKLRFRFITIAVGEEIFNVVRKGMNDAAAAMQVDADLVGTPGVDSEELLRLTRQAIADGVDGIVLNITEKDRFTEIIANAKARSIPVVGFNIDAGRGASGNLSYIAQDLRAAGETLGRRVRSALTSRDRVIATLHDDGVWALEQRLVGIQSALRDLDLQWKIVTTGQDPAKGAMVLSEALAQFPARALFGTGQGDTEACGLAARALEDSAPFVAGFDLSPGIVDLITEGFIAFSIDQQPYVQGFYPVVQLALYLRYGLMPSSMDAGAAVIDRSAVESVRHFSHQAIR